VINAAKKTYEEGLQAERSGILMLVNTGKLIKFISLKQCLCQGVCSFIDFQVELISTYNTNL